MIILVSGGSCSGKTTLAGQFVNAAVLSMDDFYVGKSRMKQPYNFDVPEAFDLKAITSAVRTLKSGKPATIPVYSMVESEPVGTQVVQPKPFIVVEGIFALNYAPLRELADLKLFLQVPSHVRVQRRIVRDVERGRDVIATLEHSITVEKMHDIHVEPTVKFADLVLQV